MAVVCLFHDISIHVYSKKNFGGICLFFQRQIGTKTPKLKIFRYMYIPKRVLMVSFCFFFSPTDWSLNSQLKKLAASIRRYLEAFTAFKFQLFRRTFISNNIHFK